MNRGITLFVAVVVIVAAVGLIGLTAAGSAVPSGPVGTAVAQDDPVATNETNGTSGANETSEVNETDGSAESTTISPGGQLSGVVGVQRAEINGEVESRSFEVGLNRSDSDAERAELVAERLNRSEQRLAEIEERQRELRERRDAGELSQGAFAARMAETSARAETVRRGTNRSADVARGLPETVRTERGLDTERLDAVRDRASELSGPEVAAAARGVTGDDVGGPLASDRRGPPSTDANGSERRRGGQSMNAPSSGGDGPTDGTDRENRTSQDATLGVGDGGPGSDDASGSERQQSAAGANGTDDSEADGASGANGSEADGASGSDDSRADGGDDADRSDRDEPGAGSDASTGSDASDGDRSERATSGGTIDWSSTADALDAIGVRLRHAWPGAPAIEAP